MDGILIVNKPSNITSHDVVSIVKKNLKVNKIGHSGTLDPIATGVLVLLVGNYTKYSNKITAYEKEYRVKVKVGIKTDTYDIDGNVLEQRNISINKEKLRKVILSFEGKYIQQVPIYSAVKVDGKKLYEYARNNEKVNLPKREVNIISISDIVIEQDYFSFKCKVSKGTYIRSLVNDICNKANIIGTIINLVRLKQGNFSIKQAYTLDEIVKNKFKLLDFS